MSFNLSSLKSKVPNFTENLEPKSKSCSQHEKRNEIEPVRVKIKDKKVKLKTYDMSHIRPKK